MVHADVVAAGEYGPEPPRRPNILDQLVAALCDASLEGNP